MPPPPPPPALPAETNTTVADSTLVNTSALTSPVAVKTSTWCSPTMPDRCFISVNEQLSPEASIVPTRQSASPVRVPYTSSLSAVISSWALDVFSTMNVNVTSPPVATTVSTSVVWEASITEVVWHQADTDSTIYESRLVPTVALNWL